MVDFLHDIGVLPIDNATLYRMKIPSACIPCLAQSMVMMSAYQRRLSSLQLASAREEIEAIFSERGWPSPFPDPQSSSATHRAARHPSQRCDPE